MNNYDMIFAPVITEKSASMEAEGKYVFKVDVKAIKHKLNKLSRNYLMLKWKVLLL